MLIDACGPSFPSYDTLLKTFPLVKQTFISPPPCFIHYFKIQESATFTWLLKCFPNPRVWAAFNSGKNRKSQKE